jgi:hypothetical protein
MAKLYDVCLLAPINTILNVMDTLNPEHGLHITARRYLPTDLCNLTNNQQVTILAATINNPIQLEPVILIIIYK